MGITFPTFRRLWNSRYDSGSIWPRRATPDRSRKALLRLIAIAAEERIPAIPLILNWSADERGVQKRRLRRLAGLLQANVALPDAIERARRVGRRRHSHYPLSPARLELSMQRSANRLPSWICFHRVLARKCERH